jgi:hypothetical protein
MRRGRVFDDGMSDEPKKRSWAWIGWALIAAIVLYPLSSGPAFAIARRTGIEPLWMTTYRPMVKLAPRNGGWAYDYLKYWGCWLCVDGGDD